MPNSELHKRISELEHQNQELLAENRRLREMLGLSEEEVKEKETTSPILTQL